jgi:fermentation-respiration switch protein FrsA (DUF1100 family)
VIYLKDSEIINLNVFSKKQPRLNKPKKRKKLKIILCTLFVVIIIVFSAIPPVTMHKFINMHVDFKETYSAEDFGLSSEKLMLTTTDGLNIAAHEVYTQAPKAVVIFISGIHNPSVTGFFGHAKMLQENNYASILLEMRAHGESEGDVICLGYKEYLDTKAVVDYIKQNNKYKDVPIVVFGVSMGGATAINSIGEIKEIDGLISISAYSSWEDVFCDNMVKMGVYKPITQIEKPFVKLYAMFKYGFKSFNISPKDEIKKLGQRPALIIHSTKDSQVPFSSFERIIENAPNHVESWVKDGDLHFILEDDNFLTPQDDKEYSEHILTFLNKHFEK